VTPQEEMERAERARQILDDTFFKEHVEMVSEALLAGMRSSAIKDKELRLRLLDRYELLHSILDCLRTTMESGKLARRQLEIEAERKSFLEKMGIT
jgi:hypothetical protein